MNNPSLRWYGWGYTDISYKLEEHPGAWPYLKAQLNLTEEIHSSPVALDAIQLRPSRLESTMMAQLREIVGPTAVCIEDAIRITHSFGKSYCDLIRLRAGVVANPTDVVVFPATAEEIAELLEFAVSHRLAIIPFGGGTSVVGGVEPIGDRPTITLSLARCNRLLTIDPLSQTVTAEAGIFGPDLESALNAQGFTLGHFPQSFEFSTLGGWIATRGAGHASTKYGTIESMVVSLQMVTPQGIVETRAVPASATGPSLLQLLIGSEGVYGVITRATLRIVPVAKRSKERALLFADFAQGMAATRIILQSGIKPELIRLSDEAETRTSFAMRKQAHGWHLLKEKLGLTLLARSGRSFEQGSLLLLRCAGESDTVDRDDAQAFKIAKQHGAFDLGGGPVRSWQRDRYRTPYLRDLLLERGLLIDTVETATSWENVASLHRQIQEAIQQAAAMGGSKALVLTHLSHAYRDGTSLYVTFLAKRAVGHELDQWRQVKECVTERILQQGGTLSHHHGVGSDHARWLLQENGKIGLGALRSVKKTLDPQAIMNPEKLFPLEANE